MKSAGRPTKSASEEGAEASSRYKLVAMKLVSPSRGHLEKHYEDLAEKPFYKGLVTCSCLKGDDIALEVDRN